MIKTSDLLWFVLAVIAVLAIPHIIYMALWEFFTWGNAVWGMGEWSSLRRAGWFIYEVVFIIGIIISAWG